MASSYKLLYLSSTEWGNLGRRKVRLAHELAQQAEAAAVFFVNPPVTTSLLDWARGRWEPSHLGADRAAHWGALLARARRVERHLWVATGSTKTVPLTRHPRLQRSVLLNRFNYDLYTAALRRRLKQLPGDELILWLSHPLQAWALDRFPERRLAVFDWTDDWSQYSQLPVQERAELEAATTRVLRGVDVVLAVSESLRARAAAVNPGTHLAPNATDFDLLSQSCDPIRPEAADLHGLPHPRVGYIGQIGENIDYALIRATAEARPAWSFVFVGPVWATRQAEVDDLQRLPNVRFLGGRPHGQLADYLRGFDICWLPHLCNALTASMDPTKLYDYLASGRPIVSTPVAGTERFGELVSFGRTAGELLAEAECGLHENGTVARLRLAKARQNSWPVRAREVWTILKEAAASQP
ncbi:MAG: glycosyltransferase [Anaerolineales bacterium]|nr:glycosyltransferase [Anaerolineales bacterium]